MKLFDLTPVEQGNTLRQLDENIRTTVAKKIADGVPEQTLREEFSLALSQVEPFMTPADAGSLLRTLDTAVLEAQQAQLSSAPVRRLT